MIKSLPTFALKEYRAFFNYVGQLLELFNHLPIFQVNKFQAYFMFFQFIFQEAEKEPGWERSYIKDINLLVATLGPTGGYKGYGTITGKYFF